jgi:hypothetical protein
MTPKLGGKRRIGRHHLFGAPSLEPLSSARIEHDLPFLNIIAGWAGDPALVLTKNVEATLGISEENAPINRSNSYRAYCRLCLLPVLMMAIFTRSQCTSVSGWQSILGRRPSLEPFGPLRLDSDLNAP